VLANTALLRPGRPGSAAAPPKCSTMCGPLHAPRSRPQRTRGHSKQTWSGASHRRGFRGRQGQAARRAAGLVSLSQRCVADSGRQLSPCARRAGLLRPSCLTLRRCAKVGGRYTHVAVHTCAAPRMEVSEPDNRSFKLIDLRRCLASPALVKAGSCAHAPAAAVSRDEGTARGRDRGRLIPWLPGVHHPAPGVSWRRSLPARLLARACLPL
jgi:hypothetical protein